MNTSLYSYIRKILQHSVDEHSFKNFMKLSDVSDKVKSIEVILDEIHTIWLAQKGQIIKHDLYQGTQYDSKKLIIENSKERTGIISKENISYAFDPSIPQLEVNKIENTSLENSHIDDKHMCEFSNQTSTQPIHQNLSTRTFTIPNATVGKVYSYLFDFEALGLEAVKEHLLVLDNNIGLTYDPVSHILSGIPTQKGNFIFSLNYKLETSEVDRPELTRIVELLVNPDPRSLWKDLPSDKNDQYYKSDTSESFDKIGSVRIVGASIRGRSHAHEGKFRDDDFSAEYLAEAGWYVISVADGAGSASYSRKGSQIACQTVIDYLKTVVTSQSWKDLNIAVQNYADDQQGLSSNTLKTVFSYEVLGKAVFAAYKAIEAEAQTKAALPKDYATTLLTVMVKQLETGWFVGSFWVGDGAIGIYQSEQNPLILGIPDGGEYAGQTRFLTMPDIYSNNFYDRFRFSYVKDFKAIVLMTDGITDPKFQTDNNLASKEKWDELWNNLTQDIALSDAEQVMNRLKDWLTFWSPGNHDDRTLVLLYDYGQDNTN